MKRYKFQYIQKISLNLLFFLFWFGPFFRLLDEDAEAAAARSAASLSKRACLENEHNTILFAITTFSLGSVFKRLRPGKVSCKADENSDNRNVRDIWVSKVSQILTFNPCKKKSLVVSSNNSQETEGYKIMWLELDTGELFPCPSVVTRFITLRRSNKTQS